MSQQQSQPRILRIFGEYITGPEATPWWTTAQDDVDYDFMSPAQLRALGLSDGLIRDGQDWNQEWEAAALAAMDADDEDDAWNEEFDARGIELARRTVAEVPTLWVLDPVQDWHVGAEQSTYPIPATEPWNPTLVLDVPVDDGDAWPWWFEPAESTPDGAWRVPLPRDFRWDEELPAATAQYAKAMRTAKAPHDVEHALRLARPALAAMAALTWRIQGLGVRDFTNRDGDIEDSNFRSRRLHAHLSKELKRLVKETPAPPKQETGQWFAYAPLSGETFGGNSGVPRN